MLVTNWDKWQTFRKDRGTPPWIKVYRNLLSNEQWVELTDSEKGQLVSIWLLAADKKGHVPDNPKIIQRMAMLNSTPNISKFIELGFLTTTRQPPDNHKKTLCMQLDAPEESRVDKSRVDKSKKVFSKPTLEEVRKLSISEKINIDGFFDYYQSNGWKVGKNPMKDWKAAARGWSKRQYSNKSNDWDSNSTSWIDDMHDVSI